MSPYIFFACFSSANNFLIGVYVYIKCRAVAGNELVFPIVKIFTEFSVESKRETSQGVFPKFFSVCKKQLLMVFPSCVQNSGKVPL